ncbi:hypothetical protein ACFVRB_40365 [Streptomyces nojiriensis]|uniref:hypothetical protein n=1 Tax=Streptomyces nojiriensis TaxID=66374 RepID=UPI0036D794AD
MTRDGERLVERPVERRLRQALDARADGIDVRRLRPAEPPGAHLGRRPMAGLRRFALPLAGLAAAAAAGIGYLLLAPDPPAGPGLPATPPRITAPGPSPQDPTSPAPQPSGSGRRTPSVSTPPTGSVNPSPSVPSSPRASGPQPPSASPSAARGGIATSSPPPRPTP